MLVGVLSDTHDRLPAIRAALKVFRERGIDTVIHAGDVVSPFAAKELAEFEGTLHVLYGNNDGEHTGLKNLLPQIVDGPIRIEADGQAIVVGHHFGWLSDDDVAGAGVVVAGHTHTIVNELRDGTLYLNPGECCGWLTGEGTVAVLDTAGPTAEIVLLPKMRNEYGNA